MLDSCLRNRPAPDRQSSTIPQIVAQVPQLTGSQEDFHATTTQLPASRRASLIERGVRGIADSLLCFGHQEADSLLS